MLKFPYQITFLQSKMYCLAGDHVCVFAAVGGNHSVLQLLLDFGCPLATPDIHGAFPLHYAAQEAREPPHDGNDNL